MFSDPDIDEEDTIYAETIINKIKNEYSIADNWLEMIETYHSYLDKSLYENKEILLKAIEERKLHITDNEIRILSQYYRRSVILLGLPSKGDKSFKPSNNIYHFDVKDTTTVATAIRGYTQDGTNTP